MGSQPHCASHRLMQICPMRGWLYRAAGVLAWLPSVAAAQLLASGDVTDTGARFPVAALDSGGLMAQATIEGLRPATRYYYRVSGSQGVLACNGMFVTTPAPNSRAALKLLSGANLGRQGYGRLRDDPDAASDGWPIFTAMAAEKADLFIALGDMRYADRTVTAEAPDYSKGRRVDGTFNPQVILSDAGKAAFAYGWLAIDAATGRIEVEIRDVDGAVSPGGRLELYPQPDGKP
jgi:hypothetical protein